MILLFGTRAFENILAVVTFVCGYCSVNASQQVVRRRTRFTLFFVPLLTLATSHYVVCSNCGGVTTLTKEQAQNSLDWVARTHPSL